MKKTPQPFIIDAQTYGVPLSNSGSQYATIDRDDYHSLIEKGFNGSWYLSWASGNAYVNTADRTHLGQNVSIARLVTGAGQGERVRYRDQNRLNLSAANLRVEDGWAKGRTPTDLPEENFDGNL
ncbi:hypothetical protein [Woodsholea maritima]|uniref:hypothetical protein n=1 Tax=Woodsholea maritima TaxID=240237 RepID=UPI00036FFDB0|nr:hypothetical protein [Woodsholea maritima]